MSRLTRPISLPIGPNGQLVPGTLLMNNNGDAEWFAGTGFGRQQSPTFTSNASNDFNWQPSPNCVSGVTCPTTEQRQLFYSSQASQNSLNNARLETWRSPTGYNSPATATSLGIPGTVNTDPNPGSIDETSAEPVAPDRNQRINQSESQNVTNANIAPRYRQGYRGRFIYPSGLESSSQDRIKFSMYESQGADIRTDTEEIFASNFQGRIINRRTSRTSLGEVFLPIQSGISDSNSVDWSGSTLNPLEAAAFGKSLGLMQTEDVGELAGELFGSVKTAVKNLIQNDDMGNALKVLLAQEAVGMKGVLSRATGAILNPNMELLFNAPSLRTFTFNFKLSPRSITEAQEVRKIIRFFKEGMVVRSGASDVFLKTPNVFDIQFQLSNTNEYHKSLPQIKRCALISCDVDYTPDGTYMTYNDPARTLTSYKLNLRFNELTPLYDSDYNTLSNDEIGF